MEPLYTFNDTRGVWKFNKVMQQQQFFFIFNRENV